MLYCDRRDFNSSVIDQRGCLNGRARRFGVGQYPLVNFVHVRELMNVSKIHGDTNDIFQFKASGLQDLLDVLERRRGFGSDSACDQFVGRIRTFLTLRRYSVFPATMPSLNGSPLAGR